LPSLGQCQATCQGSAQILIIHKRIARNNKRGQAIAQPLEVPGNMSRLCPPSHHASANCNDHQAKPGDGPASGTSWTPSSCRDASAVHLDSGSTPACMLHKAGQGSGHRLKLSSCWSPATSASERASRARLGHSAPPIPSTGALSPLPSFLHCFASLSESRGIRCRDPSLATFPSTDSSTHSCQTVALSLFKTLLPETIAQVAQPPVLTRREPPWPFWPKCKNAHGPALTPPGPPPASWTPSCSA
jgi:hypothetical protein